MKPKKILGAALGSCVHVGGLYHFLRIAEEEGYRTVSLGPAVGIERLVNEIRREAPDIVAVSYRLTPEAASTLFSDLRQQLTREERAGMSFIFGGTPPVAEVARAAGYFDAVFTGEESPSIITEYLRGSEGLSITERYGKTLLERIAQKYPSPLLRHHFGRPTMEETITGARRIAEAGVLDVLSLAPDQNAQEHFFRPSEMDPAQSGAGGVPVRTPDDLRAIYEATRTGNHPLVRCYSGTRDLLQWAEMSVETLHNAWAAIPLCWYSVMDGRSTVGLFDSITEKQNAMRWYAEKGIPVEVNESHQWSLREAHDTLAVTMAFLAAYNAKKVGVRSYVSQFMFNTPPGTSVSMDIAKMLAKRELIETLEDDRFAVYREVRPGIAHFSSQPSIAKGQGAASYVATLALQPHIMHVVGYSEGDHAAFPEEVIESCQIAQGVLRNSLEGFPDMRLDEQVQKRKRELLDEAQILLGALRTFGTDLSDDPWSDPATLSAAIQTGLLDAPHFRGNSYLCGAIFTRCINGAWYAVDEKTGEPIPEHVRVASIRGEADDTA